MPNLVKVEGLGEIQATFKSRMGKIKERLTIRVGYSAPYAVYVHENLEIHHENGQAKFLEEPAKLLRKDMMDWVARQVRSGMPLEKALQEAGEKLKEVSQSLCPVDTGFLRDSAYVEVDKNARLPPQAPGTQSIKL